MATSDVYTFRSGSVSVTATTATPVMSVIGAATIRGWGVGLIVKVGVTAAIAGNDLLFQLARPANTPNGSGPFNGAAHDLSAPSGILQGYTTWTTAPTLGVIVAERVLPQTTGSEWETWPPTGYEWQIPAIANNAANAGLHLFVTPSVATATPVFVDLVCSV